MRAVFVSYVRDTPCHQKVAMAPTCMKVLKLTGDYMHLTQRSLFLSILYFSILLLQPLPCDSIKTYHKNKLLGKPSSTKMDTFYTLHYWLRWSIGFWNVQKVAKSRQLFLIKKNHQVIFAAYFELFMTHILRRKKIWWRWYGITANGQKRLKSGSFGAEFL